MPNRGEILRPHQAGGGEAVDEAGVAALGRAGQAVQQLHGRDRVPVRVVGVRRDGKRGVGEIGRINRRPHVEEPAVVRLPDEAHGPGYLKHRSRLGGHATQQQEAVPDKPVEAVRSVLVAGAVPVPVARRRPGGKISGRPEPLGVLGPACSAPASQDFAIAAR